MCSTNQGAKGRASQFLRGGLQRRNIVAGEVGRQFQGMVFTYTIKERDFEQVIVNSHITQRKPRRCSLAYLE